MKLLRLPRSYPDPIPPSGSPPKKLGPKNICFGIRIPDVTVTCLGLVTILAKHSFEVRMNLNAFTKIRFIVTIVSNILDKMKTELSVKCIVLFVGI